MNPCRPLIRFSGWKHPATPAPCLSLNIYMLFFFAKLCRSWLQRSWHFIPKYFSLILPTRTLTFLTSISLATLRKSDFNYTIQHTVYAQMTFKCPSELHFRPVKIYKLPLTVYKLQSPAVKHSPWLPSILCDPESFGDFGTISLQNIHVLEFVCYFTII